MRLLKTLIILAFGTICLSLAVYMAKDYVICKSLEEKTLAQAIVESQLKAELESAGEKAEKELGEVLVTSAAETKPIIVTTTPAKTTVTTTPKPATTTVAEEPVTQFTRGGILPENRDNIGFKTMFTISADEQQRVTRFLIDRYFLDGTIYASEENNPKLKAKKILGSEMENNAIAALNLVLESVKLSDMTTLMSADYNYLEKEITALRDDFAVKYENVSEEGEKFRLLYENSLKYFDRLILAVGRFAAVSDEYSKSTNQFLAALVLAGAVEEVIIPEILAVLEESFDLIEISHDIFLEGTTGTKLLSREEVTEIITNPALVLDTGLA